MAGNARRRHAGIVKTSTPRFPFLPAITILLALSFPAGAVVPDGAVADLVIGRQPANASNVIHPHVAVDPATQKVFVGDEARHRILRFGSAESLQNGLAAEAVLGQPDFTNCEPGTGPDRLNSPKSLWCDLQGRLWVADTLNHRILRFDDAASISSGAPADGVLGQVNFQNSAPGTSASTLRYPTGLVTDAAGNLYVADKSNHRVLRFNAAALVANGASASAVLGHTNFTTQSSPQNSAANGMHLPSAVAISPNPVLPTQRILWVADTSNHRVLRFDNAPQIANGAAATRVLGQVNFTTSDQAVTASGMTYPDILAADSSGRLFVGSAWSNRVLRFDNAMAKPNYAPADGVLGQTSFITGTAGSGPGGLDGVNSLALGANGRLWIGEEGNHRVLRHESAHTKVNGADADSVLGAPTTTTDLARRFRPQGIAVDPASGKLFVSDDLRNRVLRFASVAALESGAGAEAVFGQANFSGEDAATTAQRMRNPSGLAMDGYGNLWVVDQGNRRILRFNNAAQRASGTGADGVLGQQSFTANDSPARSASTMSSVRTVAVGSYGQLWASDGNRVLRFDDARNKGNGAAADGVIGQNSLTGNSSQVLDAYHFYAQGIAADAGGRLWVNDYPNHRLLRYDYAAGKANGAAADGLLGQNDFHTNNNGGFSADGVYYGTMLAEPHGRLWVADSNNHRILRWESAATLPNGDDADGALGQPDFGFGSPGAGMEKFNYPRAIARDATGHLWIADEQNERVVRYSSQTSRLAIAPKDANSVNLTLDRHAAGITYRLETSPDLHVWTGALYYTAPSKNPVIFEAPMAASGREFFRVVEIP